MAMDPVEATQRWERFRGGGDGSAFDELYRAYRVRVVRYCRARLRDEEAAVDIADQLFAYLYLKRPACTGNLESLLFHYARLRCINFRPRPPTIPLADCPAPEPTITDSDERADGPAPSWAYSDIADTSDGPAYASSLADSDDAANGPAPAMPVFNPADAVPDTSEAADAGHSAAIIERALHELSPEERDIILLHHFAELPLSEVGRVMGLPRWKVKWRYRKGLRRLKEILREFGF